MEPYATDHQVLLAVPGPRMLDKLIQDEWWWSTPVFSCLSLRSTGCLVLKAQGKLKNTIPQVRESSTEEEGDGIIHPHARLIGKLKCGHR